MSGAGSVPAPIGSLLALCGLVRFSGQMLERFDIETFANRGELLRANVTNDIHENRMFLAFKDRNHYSLDRFGPARLHEHADVILAVDHCDDPLPSGLV